MSDLTFYHLPASPNCTKPRMAMGIKGIDCAFVDVPFDDRTTVLEVSTQPLTPVLVHGDTVLFGSGAIVRYLEANFRDAPRLFSADTDTLRAIERWERWADDKLGEVLGLVVQGQPAKANEVLAARAGEVEQALAAHDYLMGDAPNAADCFVAPWMAFGLLEAEDWPAQSMLRVFASELSLPARFAKTIAWVRRMQALDPAAPVLPRIG